MRRLEARPMPSAPGTGVAGLPCSTHCAACARRTRSSIRAPWTSMKQPPCSGDGSMRTHSHRGPERRASTSSTRTARASATSRPSSWQASSTGNGRTLRGAIFSTHPRCCASWGGRLKPIDSTAFARPSTICSGCLPRVWWCRRLRSRTTRPSPGRRCSTRSARPASTRVKSRHARRAFSNTRRWGSIRSTPRC